jgi:hypothetical protein
MHRILIIHKGDRILTWSDDLIAGFRAIGCEARGLALRSRNLQERREQWRGGGKLWHNRATLERCADAVAAFRPDLIVLLNFAGLPEHAARALRLAAGTGTPLVAWLADHITALPAGSMPNLDGVHAFDTATLEVLESIYRGSGARLDFLPLAVNPSRFPNHGKPWPLRHKGLVFLGNNTADRRALMQRYGEGGGVLATFGPSAASGLRFWRRRRISPASSARIYGSFQGVLNLLQSPNTVNGLNLRAFEVPASGGLGTYPQTPDLGLSFIPDQEIIAYRNMEDLAAKTRALFHDTAQASAVMAAGLRRVRDDHTYARRAEHFVRMWLPPA